MPLKNSNAVFQNLDPLAEYFPMVARTTPQAFFGRPPKAVRPRSPPQKPQFSICEGSALNLSTQPSPTPTAPWSNADVNGVFDNLCDASNADSDGNNNAADQGDDHNDEQDEMDTSDCKLPSKQCDSYSVRRAAGGSSSDSAVVEPRGHSDKAIPSGAQNRFDKEGRTVPGRKAFSTTAEAEIRRDSWLQVNLCSNSAV